MHSIDQREGGSDHIQAGSSSSADIASEYRSDHEIYRNSTALFTSAPADAWAPSSWKHPTSDGDPLSSWNQVGPSADAQVVPG